MNTATQTLQLRIKDRHARVLGQMAREVNQVFNFCNETSARAIRERHQWLSGYDLQKLTAGFSQCDGIAIGSGTVQVVCAEYATRRRPLKRSRLLWRVSNPKSMLDAGWAMFKTMLEYKSHQAGIVFEVVNEAYPTRTCSCCGAIPASSPKGKVGLRIREWACSECATVHDRDVNAARNILAAWHRRLAAGIPVL